MIPISNFTLRPSSMSRVHASLMFVGSLLVVACAPGDIIRTPDTAPSSVDLTLISAAALESFGDTARFQTKIAGQDGRTLSDVPVRWSASPAGILQQVGDGTFSAIANGRVTVVALVDPAGGGVRPGGYQANPLADSVVIEVRQRVALLSLTVSDTIFRTINAARTLRAQVTDRRGNPISAAIAPVSWRSANSSVISIDSLGVARSRVEGRTSVTATSGGVSATSALTVAPRLPHVSCMVYAARRQSKSTCVSLDFVLREREAAR